MSMAMQHALRQLMGYGKEEEKGEEMRGGEGGEEGGGKEIPHCAYKEGLGLLKPSLSHVEPLSRNPRGVSVCSFCGI